MAEIKIVYEREMCIGCSAYVNISPERWKIDDTMGKADLIGCEKKEGIAILATNKMVKTMEEA